MRRVIITTALASIVAAAASGCGSDVPTLPEASCGSAVTSAFTGGAPFIVGSADHGSLACFTAAARACKPASILIVEVQVDTGTDELFGIDRGGQPGRCPVTVLEQPYSMELGKYKVPGGNYVGDITTTHCRVASVTAAGVLISCAGQPVIIPPTVNMPRPSQAPAASRSA
jgi:hypothetical protein